MPLLHEIFVFAGQPVCLLAQAGNTGPGFPFVDAVIVFAGVAGAVFAVCRSANRG